MPASLISSPHPHRRRGSALLFAVIGLFTVALVATVALRLVGGEQLVTENMQAAENTSYFADQALSTYFAQGLSNQTLTTPVEQVVVTSEEADNDSDEEAEEAFYFTDFSASDLLASDMTPPNTRTVSRIAPTKLMSSESGDIYVIDATIMSEDPRTNRPVAARAVRTYVTTSLPVSLQAALSAPAGIFALGPDPDRLKLKGLRVKETGKSKTKVDKCGVGENVPALATPVSSGTVSYYNIYQKSLVKDLKLEPDTKTNDFAHDTTTDSYAELLDSLDLNWSQLTTPANYVYKVTTTSANRSTAYRSVVNYGQLDKKAAWPTTLVTGDMEVTSDFRGHGLLTVTGNLIVSSGVLKWDGVILVGRKLQVYNGPDAVDSKGKSKSGSGTKSHTHIKGAVAAGLNCATSANPVADCRVEFGSDSPSRAAEHLGVDYSGCAVRAAMQRLSVVRPFGATRHLKLY